MSNHPSKPTVSEPLGEPIGDSNQIFHDSKQAVEPVLVMNDDTFKNEAEVDEMFDQALEDGAVPVPMGELLQGVEKAEAVLKKEPNPQLTLPMSEWSEELISPENLDDLIKEASPTTPRLPKPTPPTQAHTTRRSSMKAAAASSDYQESFASQRETSEMRSELESISARMSNLEATLEIVLSERSTLPKHIATIREDMNKQLTLMMDKLNTTIESGITSSAAQNASEAIVNAADEVGDQLHGLESHATAPPRSKSVLTNPHAKLSGRRRFKPVE